jgi:hypothetical protein
MSKVTGRNYVVYGPLANGATSLMARALKLPGARSLLVYRGEIWRDNPAYRADGDSRS